MRLAICMIVKNEEAHLQRCLESVKGLAPIYILDTGSTDKTCEIARRYTDKVFENEYKWNDSFCEARNYIKDKLPPEINWVLSIDADEYLNSPHADIFKLIDEAEQTGHKTIDVILQGEGTISSHHFPRLFKKECKWMGAIHNYLDVSEGNYQNIIIVYGYSEAHKKDPDRSFRILSREAMKPGAKRDIFYLAREYWYRHKYKEAIDWYNKYLKVATWVPEMADAYVMIARCYIKLGNWMLARQHCALAINLNANYKEALSLLGDLTGPTNSERWYKMAHEATNANVLFVNDIRTYREIQLIENIPDVYDYKSVLYIGASTRRQEMVKNFRCHGYEIDIVEPFLTNVEYCKLMPGIDNVYESKIQTFLPKRKYDIVMWWHGPEHLLRDEIVYTLNHIERMANKYVILACPWGKYEQGTTDGNIHENHTKHWYPQEFNRLGYKTNTIGKVDVPGSNLLAYKKIQGAINE